MLYEALPVILPTLLPPRQIQRAMHGNHNKIINHHQHFPILTFLNIWGYTGTEMTLLILPQVMTFQILVTPCFIAGTHLDKDKFAIIVCAAPITASQIKFITPA